MRETLSGAGYSVLEAEDGLVALSALEKSKVHLMVCDVNMPNMDGLTFVRRVKETPHKFTPIVMLTTEGKAELIAQGKAAGAKGWMVKPFNPTQLIDLANKLVPL